MKTKPAEIKWQKYRDWCFGFIHYEAIHGSFIARAYHGKDKAGRPGLSIRIQTPEGTPPDNRVRENHWILGERDKCLLKGAEYLIRAEEG